MAWPWATASSDRKSTSTDISIVRDGEVLTSNDAEVGDTQQVMPAQIAGPGLKLVLNGDYLRDAVAACVGESVVLRASPSPKAPIICGGDDMDAGYHLIMPMVDHA